MLYYITGTLAVKFSSVKLFYAEPLVDNYSVILNPALTATFMVFFQADKKAHHNALERKRRDHIKDSFLSLRDTIPTLRHEKVSTILHCCSTHKAVAFWVCVIQFPHWDTRRLVPFSIVAPLTEQFKCLHWLLLSSHVQQNCKFTWYGGWGRVWLRLESQPNIWDWSSVHV